MVRSILAGIVADDLENELPWYEAAFGRAPDAAPMEGLYEWHLGEHALQLVALGKVREIQRLPAWGAPGCGSVTLVADDADAVVRTVLERGGSKVSSFENDGFRTVSVRDPEGNLVTFLQRT